MSELRNKRVQVIRTYIDPTAPSIPVYDYDEIYPVTTYDAVRKTTDEYSTTLTAELEAIYRLISEKQEKVFGGTNGTLMTWTTSAGVIGETEIVRTIASEPSDRSYKKVVSERAAGAALDLKVGYTDFNSHVRDGDIHITAAERSRWNEMTPISAFREHSGDSDIHITAEERTEWNAKASQSDFDSHLANKNNPHSVTAHQIGAYTRSEIDELFANIRETFFNYRNIQYDDRRNIATLEEYDPEAWNPNYVLAYGDALPEPSNTALTYFALRPLTDYSLNETQDCTIWMKKPGLAWQNVGLVSMEAGDMVIRYPDTTMCVWLQGRFVSIYTGSSAVASGSTGSSGLIWKPVVREIDGVRYLSFVLSAETEAPDLIDISGTPGYTPIKGVDYFDGASGLGVPSGGAVNDIMIKSTSKDYDVEWISFENFITQYVANGGTLPAANARWDSITGRPMVYQATGHDNTALMSQDAITNEIESITARINQIISTINSSSGIAGLTEIINNHILNHNNPHDITAVAIGAVSTDEFMNHSLNKNNPHNVTAAQIGLGNVDNTRDIDKPISTQVQDALTNIRSDISNINDALNGDQVLSNVRWNSSNCTLTFMFRDESEMDVEIPLIDIFRTFEYDEVNSELLVVLPDGSEHRISIRSLITNYRGSDSSNIRLTVSKGIIHAEILPNSVDGSMIQESVELRGAPTAPTQSIYDKSNKLATTKWVKDATVDNLESTEQQLPLSANMGRILNTTKASRADVLQMIADSPMLNVIDNLGAEDSYAALSANMGFVLNATKAPWVHTSPSGSTYGRATVNLFGHARASDVDPLMDGNVFIGTDNGYYARADHRHPSDINKAPVHWPDPETGIASFTGEPKSTLPPDGDESDRIATTLWVARNPCVTPLTSDEIRTVVYTAWDVANR